MGGGSTDLGNIPKKYHFLSASLIEPEIDNWCGKMIKKDPDFAKRPGILI